MYAPSRMTVTVSQRSKTSSNRCEMNRSARPSSRRLRATANSRSTSTPDSAAVGSSMISTRASSETAFAISMTCWSAIERPSAGRSGSMRTPSRRKSDSTSRAHRPAVDPAEAADGLAAHEDVLGDRQVGEERGLLVDDGDARLLRLGGRREVDVLAVEAELARVAAVEPGDDLHERGLAGAVLADEGVDRAGIEAQAAGAQGDDGAERLDDPGQLEHRGCGCRRRGGHVRSSSLR